MLRTNSRVLACVGLLIVASRANADPQGIEFFEKKIRPALVEHCAKCHSSEAEKNKKLRGGLNLDNRALILTGGDTGPALVPNKASDSLMIKSLRYDGELRMPPKGKLPDALIADFEKWVNMGAPDPRGDVGGPKKQIGLTFEEGRKFWSYQQPKWPTIPIVKRADWSFNEIDRFVLAKLEAKNLQPAPDADRATLARRVYFDLIGMPPTPEEVDAFVNDSSPDAYEKLVDRLLNSSHFGERWGRHWLDVARYGESLTLRGFVLKEAWRYRDYVIDSFNNDVPFDRFIREQIAGDLLPADDLESKRRQLIATSFLQLGNNNLEEQDKKLLRMDVVDEQLDAISKGFIAQTITCARCHDHKFDPIPTRDYYAIAGILRNSKSMEHSNVSQWIEKPLPTDPILEAEYRKHEQAIAVLQDRIKVLKAKGGNVVNVAKGVLAIKDVSGIVIDDRQAKKVGTWQDSTSQGTWIGDGYTHDQDAAKGEKTITFSTDVPVTGKYEVRFAYSPGTNRASAVPVTVFSADGEKTIMVDMTKIPSIDGRYISLGEHQFEKNGQSFVIVANEGTKGHVTPDAVVFIAHDMLDKIKPMPKPMGPMNADSVASIEAELKRVMDTGPKREMCMTVIEEAKIEDAKIHIRGSVANQGDIAPRGYLRVATYGTPPTIPAGQSGRKELGDWIASPDNPLTARVIVNRTWHWLFGSGIVRTVDNFGTTGELPSHPELLDQLALSFVQDGWSVKQLVRRIVLSRTYRQSAIGLSQRDDPENRLFGRANRRRMDAESIRDTMLMVSGQMSMEQGGKTYKGNIGSDYGYKQGDNRRSVYSPVFRNALPELFEVFDFADSSMVMGQRNVSTVAPQALFMMNNPFALEQARFSATRLLTDPLTDDDARIVRAYRLTLGRDPNTSERDVAKRFLQKSNTKDAWTTLFQALFASADFRYVN